MPEVNLENALHQAMHQLGWMPAVTGRNAGYRLERLDEARVIIHFIGLDDPLSAASQLVPLLRTYIGSRHVIGVDSVGVMPVVLITDPVFVPQVNFREEVESALKQAGYLPVVVVSQPVPMHSQSGYFLRWHDDNRTLNVGYGFATESGLSRQEEIKQRNEFVVRAADVLARALGFEHVRLGGSRNAKQLVAFF